MEETIIVKKVVKSEEHKERNLETERSNLLIFINSTKKQYDNLDISFLLSVLKNSSTIDGRDYLNRIFAELCDAISNIQTIEMINFVKKTLENDLNEKAKLEDAKHKLFLILATNDKKMRQHISIIHNRFDIKYKQDRYKSIISSIYEEFIDEPQQEQSIDDIIICRQIADIYNSVKQTKTIAEITSFSKFLLCEKFNFK